MAINADKAVMLNENFEAADAAPLHFQKSTGRDGFNRSTKRSR